MHYGWKGKILFIDLTQKKYCVEGIRDYLNYLGGRGINELLMFKTIKKQTKPLDPENTIFLGSGPFVGTLVPGANRLSIDFKNVLTEGIGSANCGGQFAAEMKFAGYDHIVITGRSKEPVYIFIDNNMVYFRDAEHLWGKNTWETENLIKAAEREETLKTLTIGVGGENLVKYACIIGDRGRAAGYGGGGALFGSKNLKAIAIKGTSPVIVAHPNGFIEKIRKYSESIENSQVIKNYRDGGTLLPYLRPGQNRPHGVKNMSEEFWSDEAIACVTRDKFDKHLLRRHSCFNCPAYCSSIYQINDNIYCEGVQANTLRAFGSNLDVRNPEFILQANALANMYGLDTDQTSAAIAWAIECYENGIINKADTDGLELRWGYGPAILELIRKIAFREGFGNVLAEGVYEAIKIIGRGSEKYAMLVKKNSLMEAGMRSFRAWALGIVTSAKAGGHLRGAPGQEMQRIPPDVSKKLFNIDNIYDPRTYKDKAKLVAWQDKYKGIIDSVGVCASITMWMDINLFTPEDLSEFMFLITGENISPEQLFVFGSRLNNIERAFNLLHAGFKRKDDYPPRKLIDIPVNDGPYKGDRIELAEWDKMLDEYYSCHGWDPETGLPTRNCLKDLNLEFVIETLERDCIYL
ncbi:MAG: aldehyde ferredoxin oxidoreductase family protein [Peptococcaceae bacterium]|jgi:aldehyde:ferredoxin oxidoreductase|nr:aldehyde ferredoxin oxidoreductase family protein [Peptococcaceae bacterium]MDH7526050.1 aldehyde ferredoxin oxidoreductase family protein [Peptococcaceae bacterium]